ncbi:MAG: hypothetical protein Fur0022_34990 [Anaerolineales bacterium]
MYPLTTIPHPHPEIISRRLEKEAVLVMPIKGKIKVLNDVGARVWELVNGVNTVGDIISTISEEYATPQETVSADVHLFLDQLAERGIITF